MAKNLYAERIAEQHRYCDPKYIDYISLRVASKVEKTFRLLAVLNEEGQKQYGTQDNLLELRTTDFEFAREAREFAKTYYKGIEVQRD